MVEKKIQLAHKGRPSAEKSYAVVKGLPLRGGFMANFLVVDARQRALTCFSAAVSAAEVEGQLVIRAGLELGSLAGLLEAAGGRLDVGMPALVLGGYAARSSAGFAVAEGGGHGLVVGAMGAPFGRGGLRVLTRPISARLTAGPAVVERVAGATRSNPNVASAVQAGAALLSRVAGETSVILIEGQSDVVDTYRLAGSGSTVEVESEYWCERFTLAAIVERIVRSTAASWVRATNDGGVVTEEAVRAEAVRAIEEYLEAYDAGDMGAGRRLLGAGFGSLWGDTRKAVREALESLRRPDCTPPAPGPVSCDDETAADLDQADLDEFAARAEPAPECELS